MAMRANELVNRLKICMGEYIPRFQIYGHNIATLNDVLSHTVYQSRTVLVGFYMLRFACKCY